MTMYIIIIVSVIILAGFIYLLSIKGNYEIRRSYTMNASLETVFDKLCDFKSWPEWNPWLIHEPETRLEYSDDCNQEGGSYSWDGKYIGAGTMTHQTLQRPTLLQNKLEFTRPFKSVCDVSFELKEKDEREGDNWLEKTEVTWIMHGRMPFLFRFMIPKTKDLISKDYDLGLAMLAGKIDPNSPHPRLRFDGKINLEPKLYLSKPFEGYIEQLEQAMQSGFVELIDYVQQQKIGMTGKPMTIYHKVNTKKMHFVCDMAVPVNDATKKKDYPIKKFSGGRYYKVTLQGAYRFLELAWHSAYSHVCVTRIKIDKKRPALEVYENEPNSITTTNSLISSLYIPVK